MHLCANLSMLFTERPLAERFDAAARAGFESVEIQFPPEEETAALARAARAAGLPVTLINVPRGEGAEVGLAALPGREADFAAAVDQTLRQAEALGVEKVNILSGRPPPEADPARCRDVLVANLRHAADLFADIGVRLMVEPVNRSDVPGFFLSGLEPGLDILARADHCNLRLQFDFYHMQITEPDLPAALRKAGPAIGHVQFADAPGRHEPGSAALDFAAAFEALRETGYEGAVSAEYRPAGRTEDGLGWMPRIREMIA
ncbi:MAG: hydroxypyruvate isomerase family protein [Paracoccaceae bacterium]